MFNTLTLESFDAFLEKLKHYDYYFSYSDDRGVWKRGNQQYLEIKKICENPHFHSVYKAWEAWYTEKNPKTIESLKMILDLMRLRLIKEQNNNLIKQARPEKATDYLTNINLANAYISSRAHEAADLFPKLIWQQTSDKGTVTTKIYGVRIIKVFTELDVCAGRIIIDDIPYAYQHENCLLAYLLAKYW